jgi:regulator of sigma E protease
VIRDGETIVLSPITPQYHFIGLNFSSLPGGAPLEIYISAENEKYTDLRTGDIIRSIDGTTFATWNELILFQLAYVEGSTPDHKTVLVYERAGIEHTLEFVAYGEDVLSSQGATVFASRVGISGSSRFDFFQSFQLAGSSFLNAAGSIFKTLGLLFTSEQIGVSDLSGFIGIFTMTSNAASRGWATLFNWVGFLSVNLGIINLLPIPALDGGRIVFIIYEAITKKKPNQKVENVLHTVVFFLLMGLLVFITYHDIMKLFGVR